MRNLPRRLGGPALGCALLAALAISTTACAGSEPPATPSAPAPVQHNQSDDDFVTGMARSHQEAVDLAELVPQRSEDEGVQAAAAKIRDERTAEAAALRALAQEFRAPAQPSSEADGENDMSGPRGLEQLRGLTGTKFDTRWIGLMAEHHDDAVKLAKDELDNGINPDAKQIAKNTVAAQTAEAADLGALLAKVSAGN